MPEIFSIQKQIPGLSKDTPPKAGSKNKFFSAFMVRPNGVRFETQEETEEVILLMRRHPITNLGWILSMAVLLLVPTIVAPLILRSGLPAMDFSWGYYLIIPLMWYLGTFGYGFACFLSWYFNVYIVTNKRIVDIDWYSLLYKKLASAQLEKIQDVNYKQSGLIESFFDFGDIHIQTAGTEPNFDFEHIPQPDRVVREINKILEQHKK